LAPTAEQRVHVSHDSAINYLPHGPPEPARGLLFANVVYVARAIRYQSSALGKNNENDSEVIDCSMFTGGCSGMGKSDQLCAF
jgi:hypothetical protein